MINVAKREIRLIIWYELKLGHNASETLSSNYRKIDPQAIEK